MSYRVPTITVSVTDLTLTLSKKVTAGEINQAFKAAAAGPLAGIVGFTDEPLVSSDFKGNSNSVTIDGLTTAVVGDSFAKVLGWYDNEWGYACRTADLAALMAEKGM